jgi:L-rhamnose-H+ transport protein
MAIRRWVRRPDRAAANQATSFMENPFLGVLFHWIGGLASGSFYVPYRGVKRWSWETYWLVGGLFSWLIVPVLFAVMMTNDLVGVLRQQSFPTLAWTYLFGALWGFGGLTFGLTMRYLGMSLGMGVALGYCAAFGTLLPPAMKAFLPAIPVPETIGQVAATPAGQVTLAGVVVCLLGIAVAALAGLAKERTLSEEEKKKAVAEFNFPKGLLLATFSGIMSACFSFALTAGTPIGEASAAAGTPVLWTGLPKLVVVLLGGLTTNLIWCVLLNVKNGSAREYVSRRLQTRAESGAEQEIPLLRNYLLSALAGATWYFQFFFYTMGETQIGRYGFASWTLHMASIIIFSTLWGWYFREWKGAGGRAHALIAGGIGLLILSTVIIGFGAWMRGQAVH